MKTVELRRHTASDGDRLTPEGIAAAVEIGSRLTAPYDLLIQAAIRIETVDGDINAAIAQYKKLADQYEKADRAVAAMALLHLAEAQEKTDKALVEDEARRFGGALRRVFEALGDGGRALIVGHSPMHEAGVYGLTGQVIAPIPKGGGVRIVQDGRDFRIEPLT